MRVILIAGTLIAFSANAFGAAIVEYGTAGSVTSIAASVAECVTADDLTAASGIDVNTFSTFNFDNWDPANTSFADAVADNEFWTWGFTVDPTVLSLTLNDFDIRLDRSGTGPDDFEIQVQVNSNPAVSVLTHDFDDSASGVDFIDVDLSAIPILAPGDVVSFTLAAFNSESTGGSFDLEPIGNDFANNAIIIDGTAVKAVPEPSAFLFISLLGCVMGGLKYRKKAAA